MGAALIYTAITSLDGYMGDENGNFDYGFPSEEMHRFITEQERPHGTYLYGRRMYETMRGWDGDEYVSGAPAFYGEFAKVWRAAEKIVYSASLPSVSTARTRLERSFDADAVRELKESAGSDLSIGGPTLAASAWRAGLIDEYHVYVFPVIIGGGLPALPDHVRVGLELTDEHRFPDGVVHLHYRVRPDPG